MGLKKEKRDFKAKGLFKEHMSEKLFNKLLIIIGYRVLLLLFLLLSERLFCYENEICEHKHSRYDNDVDDHMYAQHNTLQFLLTTQEQKILNRKQPTTLQHQRKPEEWLQLTKTEFFTRYYRAIVRDFLPLTTLCFERNEPVSSTELHSLGTGPRRPPKVTLYTRQIVTWQVQAMEIRIRCNNQGRKSHLNENVIKYNTKLLSKSVDSYRVDKCEIIIMHFSARTT
uniref:Uncharacterized protein n=1 Tax=Glossina brevipalpis TaxID=37001 RepID=A0A1A9X511_9MUSC